MGQGSPRNRNIIFTSGWSNPDSEALYRHDWQGEPKTAAMHFSGRQCHLCRHYAVFNADWGLCCNQNSRHFTETVFEHFTCPWFEWFPTQGGPDLGPHPKPYGHR
ncbi:MAG: hypothetical protein ABSH53_06805 [Holophaga sp.]|jgi:hypothetical protein